MSTERKLTVSFSQTARCHVCDSILSISLYNGSIPLVLSIGKKRIICIRCALSRARKTQTTSWLKTNEAEVRQFLHEEGILV